MPEIDFSKATVVGRGLRAKRTLALPLAGVRAAVNKTQVEVARLSEMDQGDVSKLERKDDALVSTLRRYLRALDAELELTAVFSKTGHRIRIDL